MLVLPQAAQLSIQFFCRGKSVLLHLLEDLIKDTLEGPRENEKALHPVEIEPTTSRDLICRRMLYHCDTTAAQVQYDNNNI